VGVLLVRPAMSFHADSTAPSLHHHLGSVVPLRGIRPLAETFHAVADSYFRSTILEVVARDCAIVVNIWIGEDISIALTAAGNGNTTGIGEW